jgi:hypothetical protein
MGIRLWVGVAAAMMTVLVGEARVAAAGEPGQRAALAARQQLRDEVCVAMVGGYISRAERYTILTHAKDVLKPAEYESFKRAVDRLSPPWPTTTARVVHATAVVANKRSNSPVEQAIAPLPAEAPAPAVVAKKASSPVEQPIAPLATYAPAQADSSLRLTIPTGVTLPDRTDGFEAGALRQASPSLRLAMPAGVNLPDRMAWAGDMR